MIAGLLWSIKSISILVADYQPAFVFESAPMFMGLAALGIASNVKNSGTPRLAVLVFAILAVVNGALAVLLHALTGDSDAFGFVLMLSMLNVLAVLSYGGWLVRAWSLTPIAVFVVTLVALPVGGALAEVDERLLEVPLLIVSAAWISLGVRFWADGSRAPAALHPF